MTKKKKKPKLNPDDSSPSGSSSFASSGSQDSSQGSLDLAADSTLDLRIPVFPGTTAPPGKSSEPIVEPTGAVTATIPDSAQGNPNSEMQGAVIATTEPAQGNPNTDNQGAVKATNTAVDQGNSSSEDQDAVTAILEEGEFVPPSSSKPTTEHPVPAEIAVDFAHPVQTRTNENNTKRVGIAPPLQSLLKTVSTNNRSVLPAAMKKKSVVTEAGSSRQTQAGQTRVSARNDILVVDLNGPCIGDLKGPGVDSSGHSKPSSDSGLDSSSENLSGEDDDPLDIEDRFIDVVTRGMKKSARKARVRGPLNL
ncbi:hypothetical protein F2Q70_00024595 [Brassica cretica]|uniref:Uncharacterized protein n=1 Tax=Brassica cretica TaxID=69181 RepID=A0A8S9L849_BRACR|nr:hypothetical protein F2Q70_00024595 [Brassica cretica]